MAYFSQDELQAFNTAVKPAKQAPVAPKKKGPGGLEGFLVDALPAIGGGIGAVGGSVIAPFAGTVAGGAAGAGLGESIKRKLLGEKQDLGQIGIQALEGGALGGAGKALGLASKGAKGIVTGARGITEGGAETVAKQTAANTIRSKVGRVGENLVKEGRGIKPGVTQTGTSARLKPATSDRLNQYLDELGTKHSAHTQVRAVEQDLQETGKQIGDLVTTHNRPVNLSELSDIAKNATGKAKGALGFNRDDPLISSVNARLSSTKDISELRDLRSSLDETLKSFYSKGERNTSTTPAIERVLKGYRDGIDSVLSKAVPGFKEANTRYKLGLKAQDQLLRTSNPQGLKFFGIQTGVGGEGLQAAKDLTGRGLKNLAGVKVGGKAAEKVAADEALQGAMQEVAQKPVGGFLNGLTRAAAAPIAYPGQVAGQALKQEAGRGFSIPANAAEAQNQPLPSSAQLNGTPEPDLGNALLGASEQSAAPSNDPFAPENVSANVQAILAQGGKMKDVSDYLANVEAYQKLLAPATNKGLNSTASGVIADTKTGLQQLSQLADEIGTSNVNNPIIGGLRGKNPFDTKAQTLQASIATAKQIVGKALEGGVLRKEDEAKYAKILPTINDTDATAEAKIKLLVDAISGRLNEYQSNISGGTGGTDLATLGL